MDQQVTIPSEFFLKEANKEYCDIRMRLIQELLQNSLDAGSTEIRLSFNLDGYICEDNGKGMSKDRMVSALLTMGASAKEKGATGGFGAAKKLLLFAHKFYYIHSLDTGVAGESLRYRFVNVPNRIGTKVSAQYFDTSIFRNMDLVAKSLLCACNFAKRCDVYINGSLFTNYNKVRLIRDVPNLGKLYNGDKNAASAGMFWVYVQHNGLYMFKRWIAGLKRNVVLDVDGDSVEKFSQNRDGFRGEASIAFDNLISSITIDKESFDKPKSRFWKIVGKKEWCESEYKYTDLVKKMVSPDIYARQMGATSFALNDTLAEPNPTSYTPTIETSFHFDLGDSKHNKVPVNYMPDKGKNKFRNLAKVWKVCVREVLKANKIVDHPFCIGFTFNSGALASHSLGEKNVHQYLINPTIKRLGSGSKVDQVMELLLLAEHEIVHGLGYEYHDEIFVKTLHGVIVNTAKNGPTYRQIIKMAKNEKL